MELKLTKRDSTIVVWVLAVLYMFRVGGVHLKDASEEQVFMWWGLTAMNSLFLVMYLLTRGTFRLPWVLTTFRAINLLLVNQGTVWILELISAGQLERDTQWGIASIFTVLMAIASLEGFGDNEEVAKTKAESSKKVQVTQKKPEGKPEEK